jgi:hypothetical protein
MWRCPGIVCRTSKLESSEDPQLPGYAAGMSDGEAPIMHPAGEDTFSCSTSASLSPTANSPAQGQDYVNSSARRPRSNGPIVYIQSIKAQ